MYAYETKSKEQTQQKKSDTKNNDRYMPSTFNRITPLQMRIDEQKFLRPEFSPYANPHVQHVIQQKREEVLSNHFVNRVNNTGIPDAMKNKFENMSGFSFDDVKVHYNSDKPTQLQALAYTQGNQVYVAPGQEKHLGHELGHVVQQKQGIVNPTKRLGGININDSQNLENQADKIGNFINPCTSLNENSEIMQAKYSNVIQKVAVKNKRIKPYTDARQFGHEFSFKAEVSNPETLRWMEKTNKPYHDLMNENVWTNMYTIAEQSNVFGDWNAVVGSIGEMEISFTDPPSIRLEENNNRKLEFDINIEGDTGDTIELTAEQNLATNAAREIIRQDFSFINVRLVRGDTGEGVTEEFGI